MVVPMFAPIIIGIAILKGKPPATSPTMTDVTVEDDCTKAVAKEPSNKAINGLVANAKISCAP